MTRAFFLLKNMEKKLDKQQKIAEGALSQVTDLDWRGSVPQPK